MKKYLVPSIAVIIFILGLVFMLIPFIPLGWPLVGIAALLLAPYIKMMQRFIQWLAKKDRTGLLEKVGKKAATLYQRVGDHQSARKLRAIVEDACSAPRVTKNELR